jgi:hypothetical protein|tara:strand:- start:406 stop:684 length:279 start_codon:yes stop_codon:yes gene_type:complete
MPTSKKGPDFDLFGKELKKLWASRGSMRDDLPESLPLDKTTATFFKPRKNLPTTLMQTDRRGDCEFRQVHPVVSIELYGVKKGHSVGNNSFL